MILSLYRFTLYFIYCWRYNKTQFFHNNPDLSCNLISEKNSFSCFFSEKNVYFTTFLYFCNRYCLQWNYSLSESALREELQRAEHYMMEKRHTMLCRLAFWNYHFLTLVNDNAEYDVTGMLRMYPVVCVKAVKPSTHTYRVYQYYSRGYHSVRQPMWAVVSLRKRMSRRWIPTFFVI